MHRTNIYLPEQMVEKLRKIAKEKGVTFSEIIRRGIDDWLDKKKNENTKSTQN